MLNNMSNVQFIYTKWKFLQGFFQTFQLATQTKDTTIYWRIYASVRYNVLITKTKQLCELKAYSSISFEIELSQAGAYKFNDNGLGCEMQFSHSYCAVEQQIR